MHFIFCDILLCDIQYKKKSMTVFTLPAFQWKILMLYSDQMLLNYHTCISFMIFMIWSSQFWKYASPWRLPCASAANLHHSIGEATYPMPHPMLYPDVHFPRNFINLLAPTPVSFNHQDHKTHHSGKKLNTVGQKSHHQLAFWLCNCRVMQTHQCTSSP